MKTEQNMWELVNINNALDRNRRKLFSVMDGFTKCHALPNLSSYAEYAEYALKNMKLSNSAT